MFIELVCNGSPTHTIFPTQAAADEALARDTLREERTQFYPAKKSRQLGPRSFDVPLHWTTREVPDEYAKQFLPKGQDTTEPKGAAMLEPKPEAVAAELPVEAPVDPPPKAKKSSKKNPNP